MWNANWICTIYLHAIVQRFMIILLREVLHLGRCDAEKINLQNNGNLSKFNASIKYIEANKESINP